MTDQSAESIDREDRIDLVVNVASLGIVGLGGLVLIALIGAVWGSAGAGLFTELLAIWIVAAQLGVLGIQTSALRSTSLAEDHIRQREDVWSALLATGITGLLCGLIVAILSSPIGRILDDEDLRQALLMASPGVALFSINKVLIFSLNGLRHMRWVATANSTRMLGLLGFTGLVVWAQGAPRNLGLIMTVAEAVVFLVAMAGILFRYPPRFTNAWPRMRSHFIFGVKALPSGAILELNTRVDVLMLALFVSQSAVGVYGYALAFAEGHQQLAIVFRNQFNPRVARLLANHDLLGLRRLFESGGRLAVRALLVTAVAGLCGLPVILWLQPRGAEFASAPAIFAIIASGTIIGGRWIPFAMIRLQGGRPGAYSQLVFQVLCVNFAANLALIPFFGIYGAAGGTAISLVAMGLFSRSAMKRSIAEINPDASVHQ